MNLHEPTTQAILERISRHCPEALGAYLQCINRQDINGNVYFSRETVDIDMSEEWHKFKRHVKSLAREDLLSWSPLNDGIAVCMAEIND